MKSVKMFVSGVVSVLLLQGCLLVAGLMARDVSFNNEANAFSLTVLTPVERELAMLEGR